jgi:hypothetical protein
LGGTREDFPNAVAVDAAGNVYSTGSYTNSAPDFDPGSGTFLLESAGTLDKMFVSKLDADGNFVWAKQASGSHYNVGNDIAIGPNSEVLVTGYFYATQDFDPGAATFELTSEGLADAYILKLETNGNFVWAKRMGGPLYEEGVSIKTDSNGGIYTTGRFEETVDFDPNGGTANLSSEGFIDVFVQHLNASGNFQWASSVGGQDEDCGLGIAVDTQGKVLCTGYFNTTADFDPGSGVFNLTSQGEMDVFILKLENAPLGIPNNLESREAVIHPNPFQDILTVGSNGTIDTIVVYDFFGRIVLETFPLALKTELNLGYLKSGLYLATIYSEGKKSVKKIIKE